VIGAGNRLLLSQNCDLDPPFQSLEDVLLATFEPVLQDRFPIEDYESSPFPNGISSFAFPLDISLKHYEQDESKKSDLPSREITPKYFTFCATNSNGEHTYGHTLIFYERISQEQSESLREYGFSVEESMQSNLYLPRAFLLLSKWNFRGFKRFLCSLYLLSIRSPGLHVPFEAYLSRFLTMTPVPPEGQLQVVYPLSIEEEIDDELKESGRKPMTRSMNIFFSRPPINKRISPRNLSLQRTFETLDVENITTLWRSLLLERSVILVSSQNSLLLDVAESILALLYPFKWQHTYIPVMPRVLLEALESPAPYLVGISSLAWTEAQQYIPPHAIVADLDNNVLLCQEELAVTLFPEKAIKKLSLVLQKSLASSVFHLRPSSWKEEQLPLFDEAFPILPLLDSKLSIEVYFELCAEDEEDEDALARRSRVAGVSSPLASSTSPIIQLPPSSPTSSPIRSISSSVSSQSSSRKPMLQSPDWALVRQGFLRFFVYAIGHYKQCVSSQQRLAGAGNDGSSDSSSSGSNGSGAAAAAAAQAARMRAGQRYTPSSSRALQPSRKSVKSIPKVIDKDLMDTWTLSGFGANSDAMPRFYFDEPLFLSLCNSDAREFLLEALKTQAWQLFLDDRLNPRIIENDPDVIFFRESVEAKVNRYTLKLSKVPTPFITSVMFEISGNYVVPQWPKSTWSIWMNEKMFLYSPFPSQLNRDMFPLKQFGAVPALIQVVEAKTQESLESLQFAAVGQRTNGNGGGKTGRLGTLNEGDGEEDGTAFPPTLNGQSLPVPPPLSTSGHALSIVPSSTTQVKTTNGPPLGSTVALNRASPEVLLFTSWFIVASSTAEIRASKIGKIAAAKFDAAELMAFRTAQTALLSDANVTALLSPTTLSPCFSVGSVLENEDDEEDEKRVDLSLNSSMDGPSSPSGSTHTNHGFHTTSAKSLEGRKKVVAPRTYFPQFIYPYTATISRTQKVDLPPARRKTMFSPQVPPIELRLRPNSVASRIFPFAHTALVPSSSTTPMTTLVVSGSGAGNGSGSGSGSGSGNGSSHVVTIPLMFSLPMPKEALEHPLMRPGIRFALPPSLAPNELAMMPGMISPQFALKNAWTRDVGRMQADMTGSEMQLSPVPEDEVANVRPTPSSPTHFALTGSPTPRASSPTAAPAAMQYISFPPPTPTDAPPSSTTPTKRSPLSGPPPSLYNTYGPSPSRTAGFRPISVSMSGGARRSVHSRIPISAQGGSGGAASSASPAFSSSSAVSAALAARRSVRHSGKHRILKGLALNPTAASAALMEGHIGSHASAEIAADELMLAADAPMRSAEMKSSSLTSGFTERPSLLPEPQTVSREAALISADSSVPELQRFLVTGSIRRKERREVIEEAKTRFLQRLLDIMVLVFEWMRSPPEPASLKALTLPVLDLQMHTGSIQGQTRTTFGLHATDVIHRSILEICARVEDYARAHVLMLQIVDASGGVQALSTLASSKNARSMGSMSARSVFRETAASPASSRALVALSGKGRQAPKHELRDMSLYRALLLSFIASSKAHATQAAAAAASQLASKGALLRPRSQPRIFEEPAQKKPIFNPSPFKSSDPPDIPAQGHRKGLSWSAFFAALTHSEKSTGSAGSPTSGNKLHAMPAQGTNAQLSMAFSMDNPLRHRESPVSTGSSRGGVGR
jgi:DENN (AEX-3) domain/uDENN domain